MQENNDKIKVHIPEIKELTPLDLVRQKYRTTILHPRSTALTEEDLSNLSERDRTAIFEACVRRLKRRKA